MAKTPKTTIPPDSGISETEKPEGLSGAERVAERLKGGGEGSPSASSSTERVRRFREKKRATESASAPKEITPAEEKEAGALFETVWSMVVVPLANGRLIPMNPDQTERAGRVFAPVIQKYAPLLGEWRVEAMALLCVGMIVRECYVPEAKTGEAEIVA